MAADIVRSDHEYIIEMKKFPCTFNLESIGKITLSRLRYIRHNLISELEIETDTKEELVRKKNFLTLVEFRLGDKKKAQNLNDEVVNLTNGKNISSLGNRCFLMVSLGDEPEAKKCLKYLKKVEKCQEIFDELLTEAYAEQAYCYSRLGGSDNIRLAIDLFTLAVTKRPNNYLWKFGLGLVYRRATHTNIYCSSSCRLDVDHFKNMAACYLFDVGDNSDNSNLRAMAYAQLVKLRQDHPSDLFPQYDYLFRHNNLQELCEKALEHGRHLPCVLTQCGRSLQTIDLDRAIDFLERSVAIKSNTIAYHNLGICYKKKAELLEQEKLMSMSDRPTKRFAKNLPIMRMRTSPVSVESTHSNNTPVYETVSDLSHKNIRPHQIVSFQDIIIKTEPLHYIMNNNKHQTIVNNSKYSCKDNLPIYSSKQKTCISPKHVNRSMQRAYIKEQAIEETPTECTTTQESFNNEHNLGNKENTAIFHHIEDTTRNSRDLTWAHNMFPSDGWSPQEELKAYVASTVMSVPLNINDCFVQKAIFCYKYAIELSNGENLPAILDLGVILKQTGQTREALNQFNSVTNSQLSLTGHRVTVISAYEQAGLCYFELSKTYDNKNSFVKDGQKKLTRAISLAADLALTISELTDCAHDVWIALRTLLSDMEKEPQSSNQQKEKIKLLELVKDHGQIIEVVQTLRSLNESELDDQDVIQSALTSYLKLEQPENALAFQNMVSIGQKVRESRWWKNDQMLTLRAKVLLHAISGRLKETNENPMYLFQQVFELFYDNCIGLNAHSKHERIIPNNNIAGDVLVVYDDEQYSDEGPSLTVKTSHQIAQLCSCLFGLEATENLQGTGEYGELLSIQLNEMRKYQVVILVLGSETRDLLFESMLERVSYNKKFSGSINQRIIVVTVGMKECHVPICVKQFERFHLQNPGDLGDTEQYSEVGNDDHEKLYSNKLPNAFLNLNVDTILNLFCFITGQQWTGM